MDDFVNQGETLSLRELHAALKVLESSKAKEKQRLYKIWYEYEGNGLRSLQFLLDTEARSPIYPKLVASIIVVRLGTRKS